MPRRYQSQEMPARGETTRAHYLTPRSRGRISLKLAVRRHRRFGLTMRYGKGYGCESLSLDPERRAHHRRRLAVTASTHTPASSTPKAPTPRAVGVATPAPATPPTPPAPIQAPPAMQPAAKDGLPPGSVWECVVNGERTFSDAPCGARSSIRQLSELNLMDSAGSPSRVIRCVRFPIHSAGFRSVRA